MTFFRKFVEHGIKLGERCVFLYCNHRFRIGVRIVFLLLLVYGVCCCFEIIKKWNAVPKHYISNKVTAYGEISQHSYCNFRISIDAGNHRITPQKDTAKTRIEFFHSPKVSKWIEKDIEIQKKIESDTGIMKHMTELSRMTSFYVLDYKLQTTLLGKKYGGESRYTYKNLSFAYSNTPQWGRDSIGDFAIGYGLLAFSNCEGNGSLEYRSNLYNSSPSIGAKWDITQGIYFLSFDSKNLKCDTISIEFYGATDFSNMYPIPQKTTMSGIEFTDSVAIQEIFKNGLRFHAEFIELKEMAAIRIFLLSAFLSLLISFIANIVYGFVSKN